MRSLRGVAARMAIAALVLGGASSCGSSGQRSAQGPDAGDGSDAGRDGAGTGGTGAAADGGSAGSGGGPGSGGAPGGRSGSGGAPAGGSGGSAGGAGGGAGGPVDVPRGTCAGTEVTGQILTAKGPSTLAARITTTDATDFDKLFIVPTSSMDTALVAFAFSEHLAKVAPAGVSVVSTGACGAVEGLLVDGGDVPELLTATDNPIDNLSLDRFHSFWTPAQPAWSADLVAEERVSLQGDGAGESCLRIKPFVGAAGQPRTIFTECLTDALNIYDRSGPSNWQPAATVAQGTPYSLQHAATTFYYDPIVDSLGRTRVVYALQDNVTFKLSEWIDGTTLPDFRTGVVTPTALVAPGLSGVLGVMHLSNEGIDVSFSDGSTVGGDHLVSTAQAAGTDRCWDNAAPCAVLTCDTEGVVQQTYAFASTSDGTFWVAYRYERDQTEWTPSGSSPPYCLYNVSKRSIQDELIIYRVSSSGSAARTTAWTYSVTESDPDLRPFAMAARGTRLYLAIPNHDTADVFVLDSTKL
jgi:hypothetical protein